MARCTLPPEGWMCTRQSKHGGPCAAWPISATMDDKLIQMAEVAVAGIYDTKVRRNTYDMVLRDLRKVAMGEI